MKIIEIERFSNSSIKIGDNNTLFKDENSNWKKNKKNYRQI